MAGFTRDKTTPRPGSLEDVTALVNVLQERAGLYLDARVERVRGQQVRAALAAGGRHLRVQGVLGLGGRDLRGGRAQHRGDYVGDLVSTIQPAECTNYFASAGYAFVNP